MPEPRSQDLRMMQTIFERLESLTLEIQLIEGMPDSDQVLRLLSRLLDTTTLLALRVQNVLEREREPVF